MKKSTILLLFIISVLNVFAQEPTFTWGKLHSKPGSPAAVQLLGHTPAGFYIINKREPTDAESRSIVRSAFSPVITVEYMDNNGSRNFSKDVSTGRADDYVNTVYFNNAVHVISALFNKDAGKNVLTANPISTDGTVGASITIGEMPAAKMSQRGLFFVNTSPDGTKLLVLTQPEYVKEENEKIGLAVYSGNFKKDWQADHTFSIPWLRSVDNRPFVNNNGVAYVLKQVSMKGSDDTWSVFSFTGKKLQEHKLALDGKKMSSIVQAFSPEGDFTVAGYYKEEGAKIRVTMGDKASGNFIYRIDATGEQLKTGVVNPFAKRHDIIARDIVFHENNVILLGERYVITDRAAPRASGAPQTNETMFARDYTYNAMDIFIDGFDANGKPLYATKIDKDNSSKNDLGYWVSYFASMAKGKLQLVYMDNFSRYDNRAVSVNTPNIIVYASVDPVTGIAAKPVPVSKPGTVGGKGGDSYLSPTVFLKTSEGKYLIRAENNNDYRIGEMEL